jgi:DNA polymerase
MALSDSDIDLRKLLKQQLHSLNQFGLHELPKGTGEFSIDFAAESESAESVAQSTIANPETVEKRTPTVAPKTTPKTAPKSPSPAQPTPQTSLEVSGNWGPAISIADRPDALEVINAEVRDCNKCDELCAHRSQTVFGVGSPSARLVFVGEGPGADEDRLGEPFVGAAGKLLNKILAASKLKRDEVYILNTVKCRPPMNRNPTEKEIRNCWDYADRQLELIQPEFICCLGSVAAKTMLQTTESLGRLRGKFHDWKGARLVVTYHPAYLLRNEGAKRHVWEDMQMLVKEMGIDLST